MRKTLLLIFATVLTIIQAFPNSSDNGQTPVPKQGWQNEQIQRVVQAQSSLCSVQTSQTSQHSSGATNRQTTVLFAMGVLLLMVLGRLKYRSFSIGIRRASLLTMMMAAGLGSISVYGQASYNASLTCVASTHNAQALTKATTNYTNLTAQNYAGTQATGTVITESWKVKADANGQLGFFHGIQTLAGFFSGQTCLDNTSNSRQFALYSYTGNVCSGTAIAPTTTNGGVAHGGSESNSLNPEWLTLTPNGDYVVIVKTTVGSSCSDLNATYGGYYGNVVPISPCKCGDNLNCGLNTYTTESSAFSAYDAQSATKFDVRSYDLSHSITHSYPFCVDYTTGATETRIGVRQLVEFTSTCNTGFARTYALTPKSDCNLPVTNLGANITGGTRGFNYYTVSPNTAYRACATVTTNPCSNLSAGESAPEYLTSTFYVYNATPPPASFTFNCGTASTTGTFAASGTGGQTGTLTVPITGATAGSAVFNVSGTGFTGTLAVNLTAGQTSVVIPITFDGSGSFGSRTLTITASVGNATGSCTKSVFVTGVPTGTPGCVTTNLTAWFKANDLSGADGSAVSSWSNGALNGYDITQGNASYQPKLYNTDATKLINFNPVLEFDGSNDYLRNLTPLMSSTTPYTFLGVNTDEAADLGYRAFFSSEQYVDHFILYKQNGATADNGWTPYAIGGVPDRGTFGKGTKYSIDGGSNGYWNGTNFTSDASVKVVQPSIVGMSGDNVLGAASHPNFFTWADGYKGNPGNWSPTGEGSALYQSYLFKSFAIGADMSSADAAFEFWKGRIPEIVAYSRQLTDAEMAKVNTYFAIKYGTTLGQGNGSVAKNGNNYNYVKGDGAIIWDATANTTYKFDIFGIGRDDCQGLDQKQSKSVNVGFTPIISTTGFAATNTANATNFTADKSFEVSGSDGTASVFGTPFVFGTMNNRITRVWKIQETGTVGTVKVAIEKSNIPGNATQVNLLRSTDATFDGSDTKVAMTLETIGSEEYYTATIDFNNNDYYTFGAYLVTPGCVAANLTAWYKADAGVTGTTAVTKWADNINGYDVIQATTGQTPAFDAGASAIMNYNPYLVFDGSNDHLEYKAGRFMSTTSPGTLFGAGTNKIDGGYENLAVLGIDNPHMGTLTDQQIMWMNGSAPVRIDHPTLIQKDLPTVFDYFWNSGANAGSGLRQNGNEFYDATTDATLVGNGGGTDGMFTIGGWEAVEVWNGNISEVVLYDRNLTPTEKDKVDTYLAVKYGSTLSHNYLMGDGTTIYDVSAYGSHVFGIGRDDCQGLNQKQSTSTADSYVKVSLGALATTNAGNTNTFANDKNFEIIGDNNLTKEYAVAYAPTTFTPAGSFFRMNRIWKVDETGTVGSVRITVPSGADRLLVSSSATFGAGTQELLLTADGNGGFYANVDFADGAFFTFGKALTAPGCVTTGLNLWIKADAAGITNGTDAIIDNSPVGQDIPKIGTTNLLQAADAAHNYNPFLSGFSSTNFFKNMNSPMAPQGAFQASEVTMIAAVRPSSAGTGRIVGIDNDDNYSSEPDLSINAGKPAYYRYWISTQNIIHPTTAATGQTSIFSARTLSTTATVGLNGNFNNQTITAGGGLWGDILTLGYGTWANAGAFPGDIQEVIWYKSSLSDTEVQKINSYLAIKYGSTLAQNYLSGAGTQVFAANGGTSTDFDANVFGIGRDDCQGLNQKQSVSTSSSVLTVGIDNQIAASNAAHTGDFATNATFLMFGDNNLTGTSAFPTGPSACPPPPSNDKRLTRVWKVTETGTVESSKIRFDASGFGFNTDMPVYMLVSSASSMATYSSIPMTSAGGTTFEVNYDFAANANTYITFSGNTTPITNLCTGGSKELNWLSFLPFDWWQWGTRSKTYNLGNGQSAKVTVTDPNNVILYKATAPFPWYPVNYGNYLYIPRYDDQPTSMITTKIALVNTADGVTKQPAQTVDFKLKDIDGWVWGKDVVNVYGKLNGANIYPKITLNKWTNISLSGTNPITMTGSIWPWDWTTLGDAYVNFDSPIDEIYIEYTKNNTLFPTWKKFNDLAIGHINIQCGIPVPAVITPDNVYLYKEASPKTVRQGEPFTYKFTLQNLNCDAKTINLTDALPAGLTWKDSTLATSLVIGTTNSYGNTTNLNLQNITVPAGTSYLYIDAIAANAGTLNNQASFVVNGNTYQSDEPNTAGAANPTPVTVLAATKANMTITKAVDKAQVQESGVVKYTFTLSNNESTDMTVFFDDNLDKDATYISGSLSSLSASLTTPQTSTYAGANSITIRDLTIPANGSLTFTIDADANATAVGDTIKNIAKMTVDASELGTYLQTTFISNQVNTRVNGDSDGDGVADSADLDDDNDGILDSVETACGSTNTVYAMDATQTSYTGFGTDGGYFDIKYVLQSGTAVPSLGNSFNVRVNYTDFTNNFGTDNKWEGATGLTTYAGIKPNVTTLYTGLPSTNTTTENATGSSFDIAFNGLITSNAIQKLGTFSISIDAVPSPAGYQLVSQSINIFSDQNAASSTNWLSGFYARPQVQTALNSVNASTTVPFTASHGQTYIYDYTAFSSTAPTGVSNATRGLIALNAGTITYIALCDADNDGIVNSLDLDSDGDGIPDNIEAQTTAGYIAPGTAVDAQGRLTAYGTGLTPVNTDGTDNPDYTDTDSDNSGGNDTAEAGLTLAGADSDGDGLDNAVDTNDNAFGPVNAGITNPATTYPNNNASPEVNYRDNTASFIFNCSSPTFSGSFVANGTAGQSGTVTIALINATAGVATFNVTGTGFTGTLSTTLTANQASVVIPITYDGTGVAGSRVLTITSPQGSSSCTPSATVTAPIASFVFNCVGSTVSGTFVNSGTPQNGSITIGLTGTTLGSATFTVTGTDFTGTLTTSLTAGQTSVTIPITYDGSGAAGSQILTVTSAQGTGVCLNTVTVSASDMDSDGLTDAEEAVLGTNPNKADTDGDGINDLKEVGADHIYTAGVDTNPLDADTDDDGLSDGAETGVDGVYTVGTDTNPLSVDTDGDGIQDGTEKGITTPVADPDGAGPLLGTNTATFVADVDPATTTNPLSVDTDGDGLADGIEDANKNGKQDNETVGGTGTSPLVGYETDATDPDSDSDGLSDGNEVLVRLTNPMDTDTDDGGTNDKQETIDGTNPRAGFGADDLDGDSDGDGIGGRAELLLGTDPQNADTDNDGISDGAEVGADGVYTVGTDTNPLDKDTDDDGLSDGDEKNGTGPLAAYGATNPLNGDTDGDGIKDGTEAGVTAKINGGISSPGGKVYTGTLITSPNFVIDTDPTTKTDPTKTDSDNDGIADGLEDVNKNGKQDLPVIGGTGTSGSGETSATNPDSDADGLKDGDEKNGTGTNAGKISNPMDTDTDDGGTEDGQEITDGTNPSLGNGSDDYAGDPDNDGLTTAEEIALGTNPQVADTDGDGIKDGAEVGADGVYNAGTDTNPKDADTDDDGLSDGVEKNGTGPLATIGVTNPLNKDTDGDGIQDGTELGITTPIAGGTSGTATFTGTDPLVFVPDADATTKTNPKVTDSDLDGIADGVEDANKNGKQDNPVIGTSTTVGSGETDATNPDSDGDTLLDGAELSGNGVGKITNPMDKDSDNGGTNDNKELLDGTNPSVGNGADDFDADNDGDGLTNAEEGLLGTNPNVADTDGDGLSDFAEVGADKIYNPLTDTNPKDADTDDDGLSDGTEKNATGPLTAYGATNPLAADTDGDGIKDGIEAGLTAGIADPDGAGPLLGTTGFVADADPLTKTNPTLPDTDGDGLSDGVEDVNKNGMQDAPVIGNSTTVGSGETNPNNNDSDADGLTDGFEVNTSLSNPMDTDSDNGGILDKYESDNAMNPNSATDDKDSDGDGVPDAVDTDDDNDGVLDTVEGTIDTDGDGIPNNRDLDSDNDGINDVREANGTDANNDGIMDGTPSATGVVGAGLTPPDTDGDGVKDFLDLDSDNDALSDLAESGYPTVDANNNGVADGPDTDLDGIVDSVDAKVEFGDLNDPAPKNTDGTDQPDYRDVDSNNDGKFDIVDAGKGSLDGNADGKVDAPLDPDGDGIANNGGLDTLPLGFGGLPAPDSDGDGIANYLDNDDDNDGILDTVEGTADTDGDGVPNNLDLDSDNDGINDIREANGVDLDNNGLADGTPNATGEIIAGGLTPPDSDGDGVKDMFDLDTDNDGIGDLVEGGSNGTDLDNDGVVDGPDSDGDGIMNSVDGKVGTGDLNDSLPKNTDGTDQPDFRDTDSNNDGKFDIVTIGKGGLDVNLDGRIDNPTDPDGDGIANNSGCDTKPTTFGGIVALDSDGDGIPNAVDTDDDNDGILDTVEGFADTDGDGTPNNNDLDSDNDGINDVREANGIDVNNDGIADGIPNAQGAPVVGGLTPPDTDGDGVKDYLDLDSDNDALSDLLESGVTTAIDANNDGVVDGPDDDGDGIMNTVDFKASFGDQNDPLPVNTDGTDNPDYRDLDSNNDSQGDILKTNYAALDINGDGRIDAPVDPDGDGIANNGGLDFKPAAFGGLASPDTDGDGIPDNVDIDDDNDGVLDTVEGTIDTDGDGIPNNRDLDSDNDGINDVREANGVDTNNDGIADGTPNAQGSPAGGALTPPDTDGDGVKDMFDLDSDNDAQSDLVEGGSNAIDADKDGVAEGPDADGDGIVDSVDAKVGFGDLNDPAPKNTDGTDQPDYRDVDSNNDGTKDIIDAGKGALDLNGDGKIDSPLDPDGDGIANNGGLDDKPSVFGGLGITSSSVKITSKVFLQGAGTLVNAPFTANVDGMMRTDLTSVLPTTEPYTGLGYTGVTVKAGSPVFTGTGNDAIVDWILVELRSATLSTTIVARQAGLLQKDGDIVDIDGVSPLTINVPNGNYFVSIRHRNHLGVMAMNAMPLNIIPTTIDFTTNTLAVYGTNSQAIIGGKNYLWAGNANVNSNVIAQGSNSDRSAVTNAVTNNGGNTAGVNTFILNGYLPTDVNMDGKTIAKGTNADNTIILNIILGYLSNTAGTNVFIITQQLP